MRDGQTLGRGPGPIDRDLQRELLVNMRDTYPRCHSPSVKEQRGWTDAEFANLTYLKEHGLCQFAVPPTPLFDLQTCDVKITAKGLDFLADDGGLSAILGVVTIKFHADAIRDLIAAKIAASSASEAEKSKMTAAVKNLSGAAIQAAINDLVKLGLEHMPDPMPFLRSLGGIL